MTLVNGHSCSKSMIPEDIMESVPSAQQVAEEKRNKALVTPVQNKDVQNGASPVSGGGHDPKIPHSKSKNPFKKFFGRSKSHHLTPLVSNTITSVGYQCVEEHVVDAPSTHVLPMPTGQGEATGGCLRSNIFSGPHKSHKTSIALPSIALHNSNPFANGGRKPTIESPFAVLGTGTEIASPRNLPGTTVLSNRNTSHNLNMYTPTMSAQSSRSLSYYQMEGNDKHEKLLPLPVKNPNDELPVHLRQPSVLLTDNFSFPSCTDGERKIIGEGGSSQVVTIVSNYRKSTVYALKRFKMFSYEEPEEFYSRCMKEYLIAKRLDGHINIIKTFYLMKVPSSATNGIKRSWAFVMQQCVQDMYYYTTLTGWTNKLFEEKWCCFKQIARGLSQMHSLGIAHRDIKLENVLVTDYGALKLTDFGVSTYGIENPDDPTSKRVKLKGFCGSPPHVPPEVMLLSSEKRKKVPIPDDKLEYDPFAMDMWALGVVLYTLIIPYPLFAEAHKDDSRYRQYLAFYDQFTRYCSNFKKEHVYKPGPGVEHPEFSKFQNTDATRVCLRLLDPDPDTRYKMEDLYNDPWFQSIETCVDEGTEEPVKIPELRKTTEGSDSPYAHDILPGDEESLFNTPGLVSHTSNPFLNADRVGLGFTTNSTNPVSASRPSSSSRSLINIAEDTEPCILGSLQAQIELPTLDEEDINTPKLDLHNEERVSLSPLVPTKKISNLSLNDSYGVPGITLFQSTTEHPPSPILSLDQNNGHYISRSSSVVSRNSSATAYAGQNSSGSSLASLARSKRKKIVHMHHECNGKPITTKSTQ
ncbi:protein kinase PTK2 Ecym_3160 [Eremothecium cymbalariae DBVPG|uniref:Protein kinase domain-containing protein n=1 Tax=Eremothecium cymbalariae (strain CBS 270.75 / DBVPG 7215 / KCTC 17166 / NRRL Y-17582) TaxID=931890 RepID=G8JR94_ERECY|nr:Hypothetical protein Ecym_3160 [Eremothecium cymbalariae DBVPG\